MSRRPTVTMTEAADILGVSRQRVNRLVLRGDLKTDGDDTPRRVLLKSVNARKRAIDTGKLPSQGPVVAPEGWITTRQLADREGVTIDTVLAWVADDRISGRRRSYAGSHIFPADCIVMRRPVGRPPS